MASYLSDISEDLVEDSDILGCDAVSLGELFRYTGMWCCVTGWVIQVYWDVMLCHWVSYSGILGCDAVSLGELFRYTGMWCCVTGWVIPCESNDYFTFRVKQSNLGIKQSSLRLLDPSRQKHYSNFKSCKLLTQQHSDACSLFYTFFHSCYFTLLGSKCFPQCMYFIRQKMTKFYTTKNSR